MQKRGSYFFVLDVFIAATILVLTIVIILSSRENVPDTTQPYLMAEDYMQFITGTEVRDLSSLYKTDLIVKGAMQNTDRKLYQQIAYFHYQTGSNSSYRNISYNFVEDISQGIIPKQYGFSYKIGDVEIYNRSSETLSRAELVVVSRKMTFFKIDRDTMFGPAITEVKIWT